VPPNRSPAANTALLGYCSQLRAKNDRPRNFPYVRDATLSIANRRYRKIIQRWESDAGDDEETPDEETPDSVRSMRSLKSVAFRKEAGLTPRRLKLAA